MIAYNDPHTRHYGMCVLVLQPAVEARLGVCGIAYQEHVYVSSYSYCVLLYLCPQLHAPI